MEFEQTIKDNLSTEAADNLLVWVRSGLYKEEIETLIRGNEWQELEDSFFKVLEFGTAGRRGRVGPGCNRINDIIISESAQALADYILIQKLENPSVAIAYDTRNTSKQFSELSAAVLAENSIKTYLFDGARSTPELSFAVRELQASAGIVISASHNPPEDNGIKVYWSDGAQVSSPHDKNLMKIANNLHQVNMGDFIKLVNNGQIEIIGKAMDDKYIAANCKLSLTSNRDLKIVYSPLHGAGMTNLFVTLNKAGFNDIQLVEEQVIADGNFPFVPENKPNPENVRANELAWKYLKKSQADISIVTDPDADRICISSLEKSGDIRPFNGNESAILAVDYILRKKEELGVLDGRQFVAKTIVTTDAINALAQKYNVMVYDDMLVGFKYIGRKILEKSLDNEEFLIGSEESYGQLVGDQVRDKDAASAGLVLAELAADLKQAGVTLGEQLDQIYEEIGYFYEQTVALDFPGANGFDKMKQLMVDLKSFSYDFTDLGNSAILDYEKLKRYNLTDSSESEIDCTDTGNVVVLEFAGDHRKRMTIRPSGTEPKLKIYIQWWSDKKELAKSEPNKLLNDIKDRILN